MDAYMSREFRSAYLYSGSATGLFTPERFEEFVSIDVAEFLKRKGIDSSFEPDQTWVIGSKKKQFDYLFRGAALGIEHEIELPAGPCSVRVMFRHQGAEAVEFLTDFLSQRFALEERKN